MKIAFDPLHAVLSERELACTSVSEEASEVNIELSKAKRFGWEGVNVYDDTTPAERMATEVGDLMGSITYFLETHPEVEKYMAVIEERAKSKKAKLLFWNDPRNHGKKIEDHL
jgi:hypothetical protein